MLIKLITHLCCLFSAILGSPSLYYCNRKSYFSYSEAYWQKQPPEVFYKKVVLTNFSKFAGKQLCQCLFFKRLYYRFFPVNFLKFVRPLYLQNAFGSQLAQRRCDNVVTTSLLTLSQRCSMVENESCTDVSFRRCDNIALQRRQDVAQRCLNVDTTSPQH